MRRRWWNEIQGPKSPRIKEQKLLAEEDELVPAEPDVARIAPARGEPPTTVDVTHIEQAQVAIGSSDRLHGNGQPLVSRLIRVLESKLRSDFRRTEIQAQLPGPVADYSVGCALGGGEAELRDRELDELDLSLLLGGPESLLVHDVPGPVSDPETVLLKQPFQGLTVPSGGAELHDLPDREGGNQFTVQREQATSELRVVLDDLKDVRNLASISIPVAGELENASDEVQEPCFLVGCRDHDDSLLIRLSRMNG